MVIRILDHVEHAVSYDDGEAVFKLISPAIKRGEDVTLSFSGIDAVPTSFVNASVVRLAELVSVDELKAHLRLTDSTKQINDLIRSRIAFLESEKRTRAQ